MLTPLQFQQRQDQRFGQNEFQNITEESFRDLASDILATFVAQTTANVPEYDPATYYAQGFVIQHRFGTARPVFLAAVAPGFLPAPTDPDGDAAWQPSLSPSQPAVFHQAGSVQALRLVRGSFVIGRLYIVTGRTDGTGAPLDDVYVRALAPSALEPEGYTLDNSSSGAPAPVTYDLDTDTTSARGTGGGGAVDAYTKAQSDARYVQSSVQAAGYAYAPAEARDATTTFDIAGRYVAHLELSLRANTTLELTNVPNGYQGAIKVINVQTGPVSCALPKGSFGPKNYYPVLAAGEIRMLGIMKAGNTLCFNSQPYFEVK